MVVTWLSRASVDRVSMEGHVVSKALRSFFETRPNKPMSMTTRDPGDKHFHLGQCTINLI